MPTPDFNSLCDTLEGLGATDSHPAELHGLACGILAAGFQPSPAQWLQQAANYTDQPVLATESPLLMELYTASQAQLTEGDFNFRLCLPDDDLYGLAERSDSLARWCQGFLHGFAAIQSSLSDDNRELLQDLTEISRLAFNASDSDGTDEDEQEGYYAELTEFVRMAAISLFMDYGHTAGNSDRNQLLQ